MQPKKKLFALLENYANSEDIELVEKAHSLCLDVLNSEDGKTPALKTQAISVASILAELETSAESVAAALLIDLPEKTCPESIISERVSPAVADLVAGIKKIRKLPYLNSERKLGWSDKQRSELYNAFVSSLESPQPILVQLAHVLYWLRNLDKVFSIEQREIVFDALEIYAPLAHRLGIWRIKWEMEDLAFRFTNPDEYHQIASALSEKREQREKNVNRFAATLKEKLEEEGIQAQITGRSKHIYSIYQKMKRKGVPIDAVYDIRALRVLVDTEAECYRVLSIIHNLWTPIPDQFDDYISNPKPNGYQSLHTAVLDSNGKSIEVQIRTWGMHEESELGVAAHWRYKEQNGSIIHVWKKKDLEAEKAIQEKISWLRMLIDETSESNNVQKSPVKIIEEEKPIFVFTPAGDVIRLPIDSTPVDFAYRIHTELGHRCSGAKVNGKIVPLDHPLADGDTVEIITRKRGGPNIQWLSKDQRYTKTKEARRKISSWFRSQRRNEDITQGHEILDRELAKQGLKSSMSFDQVAESFNLDNNDDLLVQIGSGAISVERLQTVLSGQPRPSKDILAREADKELVTTEDEIKTLKEKDGGVGKKPAQTGLLVDSTQGLHSHLAKCCNPVPPEKIVGYVTRGHGVTIHVYDCPNVLNEDEKERIIPASWGETDSQSYPVMVMIEAINRQGLLGDIGQAVARENVDIYEAKVKKRAHWAIFELILDVTDADQLERVMQKLTETKGVRLAYRRKG